MMGRITLRIDRGTVGRGMVAGALATVVMSGVIAAARAAGLVWTPPPREITANALGAIAGGSTGAVEVPQFAVASAFDAPLAFRAGWISAHLLYGAMCGVLFAIIQRWLSGVPRHPLGLLFGVGVWLGSYLGALPALRLYPSPQEDSRGRIATMIAAHVVFGVSLAEIGRRLARR